MFYFGIYFIELIGGPFSEPHQAADFRIISTVRMITQWGFLSVLKTNGNMVANRNFDAFDTAIKVSVEGESKSGQFKEVRINTALRGYLHANDPGYLDLELQVSNLTNAVYSGSGVQMRQATSWPGRLTEIRNN